MAKIAIMTSTPARTGPVISAPFVLDMTRGNADVDSDWLWLGDIDGDGEWLFDSCDFDCEWWLFEWL
jgi:hypothetical protein